MSVMYLKAQEGDFEDVFALCEAAARQYFDHVYGEVLAGNLPDELMREMLPVQVKTFRKPSGEQVALIVDSYQAPLGEINSPIPGTQEAFDTARREIKAGGYSDENCNGGVYRIETLAQHYSVRGENEKLFEVIKRGGTIDASVLSSIVKSDDMDMIKTLFEDQEADPNQTRQAGNRPIGAAMSRQAFLYLVSKGADPTYKDDFGDDATHYYAWGSEVSGDNLREQGLKKFAQGFIAALYEADGREPPVFADGGMYEDKELVGSQEDFDAGHAEGLKAAQAGYIKNPLFGERSNEKDPFQIMAEFAQRSARLQERGQALEENTLALLERKAAFAEQAAPGKVDSLGPGELVELQDESGALLQMVDAIQAEGEAIVQEREALQTDMKEHMERQGLPASLLG